MKGHGYTQKFQKFLRDRNRIELLFGEITWFNSTLKKKKKSMKMVAEIVFLTSHLIFFKYSFAVSARSGNILIIIFFLKKKNSLPPP